MKLECSNCKYCTNEIVADGESNKVGCGRVRWGADHSGRGRRSVMLNGENFARCDHYVPAWAVPFPFPKPGETPTIRFIQPDNVVECLDNTGMEDGFDVGVEYVFDGRHDGEMISVYDKIGKLRECFSFRFKVKSSETTGMFTHRRAMKSV